MSYKQHYSRFLKEHQGQVHFACHSHHFWPDVTRDAMLRYWDDSAKHSDDKWDTVFGERLPAAQKLVATELGLPQTDSLVFAPNTHELLYRIISSFYETAKPVKILCTSSEFHSFRRQSRRLHESGLIELTLIDCEPWDDFEERFIAAAKEGDFDLIFCSQVFFDSGCTLRNLDDFIEALRPLRAQIVIDGYHGFMALPINLSKVQDRIFFLAGAYKYAQGGEGACFLHVPPGCSLRPVQTGWFADFANLEKKQTGMTQYAEDAMRFGGATMDFAPLYRLEASMTLLTKDLGLNGAAIHAHVQKLQKTFLDQLDQNPNPWLSRDNLIQRSPDCEHGHFFTFRLPTADLAIQLHRALKTKGVLTDCRGERLRFGFAIYHDSEDYDLSCLKESLLG